MKYFWNWNLLFNVQKPSLVAQRVKHLPAKQETWVPSQDQEDPLEKEMETHSSILAWRIPWTEEPGRLQSMGLQRVGHDCAANTHTNLTRAKFTFQKCAIQSGTSTASSKGV